MRNKILFVVYYFNPEFGMPEYPFVYRRSFLIIPHVLSRAQAQFAP